jgi:hypothetical protein
MSDSNAIDLGLVAYLGADTALAVLMPDGVWWDIARQGAFAFVVVSIADSHDEDELQDRAYEQVTYQIQAVERSTKGDRAAAAAARIDQLLDRQTFPVNGFTVVKIARDGRIRQTEIDDVDRAVRWQHRGGRYTVQAQAVPS